MRYFKEILVWKQETQQIQKYTVNDQKFVFVCGKNLWQQM
jgi:hypothetical protein